LLVHIWYRYLSNCFSRLNDDDGESKLNSLCILYHCPHSTYLRDDDVNTMNIAMMMMCTGFIFHSSTIALVYLAHCGCKRYMHSQSHRV